MKICLAVIAAMWLGATAAIAQDKIVTDAFETSAGELKISFIGHGSLMMAFAGKIIHVDPWSRMADYSKLPKADLVLLTHDHYDHLDLAALMSVRSADTVVILPPVCDSKVKGGTVMTNGDVRTELGVKIEAVPAYNLVHRRDDGQLYHPKGVGNGYVLTFGDKRIYVAGDTENTPEMKSLKQIDCAFLPMNLPYTMTPEMVADAAKAFRPKILYPYHHMGTNQTELVELLKDTPGIEVRINKMK